MEDTKNLDVIALGALESTLLTKDEYQEGSIDDYLQWASQSPSVAYSAYQRMYAAIVRWESTKYDWAKSEQTHWKFFDDPFEDGKDAVFSLDPQLKHLVDVFKAGASRLGQERRIILAHGPVGSSKSTIARLLRKGLQHYTRTDDGKLFTFEWVVEPNDTEGHEFLGIIGRKDGSGTLYPRHTLACPVHEDPFMLLPADVRAQVALKLNKVEVPVVKAHGVHATRARLPEEVIAFEGDLCPLCRFVNRFFLRRYAGDWKAVLQKHIRVQRLVFSEVDRIGLGSFRPKDEKNQDSEELSGGLNYRKIAEFGSESDPRSFNFDGEFQVSHRGFFYAEEIFKLDKAFLYDFLGATQEHVVKPKRFSEMYIDEVLMGGTNNPEYKTLQEDEKMEAFRDRTTRIDVPYVIRISGEQKVYEKGLVAIRATGGRHIAPHVTEMTALWTVLSRLEQAKKLKLDLLQKAWLYDDRSVPGMTAQHVKELREESPNEGMSGISARYAQDKIGNALVADIEAPCVTPFGVFAELEGGLGSNSLIKSEDQKRTYLELLATVKQHYDQVIVGEVQEAISAEEKDLLNLFNNYLDNVLAYANKEKVKDPDTGEFVEPDERLMRRVEQQIDVSENAKDEFRSNLLKVMATKQRRKETFDYKTDEQLLKALKLALFQDRKDSVRLTGLRSGVVDHEEQEKIDIVKKRLRDRFGYCDFCATMVLNRTASIFAEQAAKSKK